MTRTLEERLEGSDPEPWIAEEGDSVFGEIEEIAYAQGDYEPYPLVTIYTDEGDVLNVACWDSVCKSKFEELKPEVGDRIGFKFVGLKQGKKNQYKNWRLVLTRANRPAITTANPFAAENEEGE